MAVLVVQPGPAGVDLQILELKHGADAVQINLHGATLTSWVCGGEELIFVR
jgi:D-hexose-6-phosphate mutarotase